MFVSNPFDFWASAGAMELNCKAVAQARQNLDSALEWRSHAQMMEVEAEHLARNLNEKTSRIELLQTDVTLLVDEVERLRNDNAELSSILKETRGELERIESERKKLVAFAKRIKEINAEKKQRQLVEA